MTQIPRLLAGGLLFALVLFASDWVLSHCVWSLHVWRFPLSVETFDAFWLTSRPQEHGNIRGFVVRYALILSSLAVGTVVWTGFNQAVLSAGQQKSMKKSAFTVAFVVPLVIALVVASTASIL